jgi:hypothetical protein
VATLAGVAALVVATLAVAGCQTEPPGTEAMGSDRPGAAERSVPVTGDGFEGNAFTEIEGATPFTEYSEYLDGPGYDHDARMADRVEWYAQVEDYIAQCMKEEGFEYFPAEYWAADLPESRLSFDRDFMSIPLLPANRADVVQWGYGVAPPLEFVTGSDILANQPDDPNEAYFDGLSASGQRDYLKAYDGYYPEDAPLGSPDLTSGCGGMAFTAFPEPGVEDAAQRFNSQYGTLALTMGTLATSGVFDDRRIGALAASWESCMRAIGVDVSSETVDGMSGDVAYPNPNSAWYMAMRTGPDGSVGTGGGGVFDEALPLEQRSLIGSEAEARIALADFDCRIETEYETRFKEIQLDLEQQFVDQNRDQLEEMVAAAKNGTGVSPGSPSGGSRHERLLG